MGTWGPGPFESDTAEDFMQELDRLSASKRLAVIERTFRSAVEGDRDPAVLPEEVVVAAAVVAANVPAGRSLPGNEEYPDLTRWLAQPITSGVAALAVQALDRAIPLDGWYWQSWVDPEEKAEAQAAVERVRAVLNGVDGPSR